MVITLMHMQVMQQSLLHSIRILNERIFDSPGRPGMYLPRKMNVEPDLSLVRDTFPVRYDRVLAKSRNRCKFIQVLLQCIVFEV